MAGQARGFGWMVAAGLTVAAGAQSAMPDAQVEANVLRALAGAPELASEAISTQTVYGTVTLSGSVSSEARRVQAEKLAANADGVKKVVDELRLGNESAEVAQSATAQGPSPLVLQSDGTYAPAAPDARPAANQTQATQQAAGSAPAATAQRNNPDADQQLDRQIEQQQAGVATAAPADPSAQPQPGYGRRPLYNPNYGYPTPAYPAPYAQAGGQQGGESVVIPSGTMVRVRIDRALSSNQTPAGTPFDGVVVNDVVAGNQVAIPRGAAVKGTVVEATTSGALKGRGEMTIQLTEVTLGGRSFPLISDVWGSHGRDKTIETVNKTAGFGAVGAVIGALAGGGVGAAVGGGIGAAAGLGSSAASGDGQVYVPAESLISFHTAQPATVVTVNEQEMQRLAYGVPAGAEQRPYRRPYPRVYVGPRYYPYAPGYGPYGPYGYPSY